MSFARNLFTVSSLTIVSRLSGFVRDTLTATYLGAGIVADAAFVAQRLPNLFRSLFAEGAFSSAFVPLYTTEQKQHGTPSAQQFAGQALAFLLAILIPFSILMMVFMPYVVRVLAYGYDPASESFRLALEFSVITFPYLTLISVTALQGGVLNAHSKFGAAAAAPISLNIVVVAALITGHLYGWNEGYVLSWAFLISGFVQMSWLAISCYRARLSLPLARPRMTGASQRLFKRIGPGALGAGAAQVNMLLSTMLASTLPTGGVSCINYADRLNQLPLGIIGIAVATTLLPLLSRHIEEGDEDNVRHYISRAIEFCLMLGLPAALGFVMLAEPIVQTLFEHGEFSHETTIKTAQTLSGYAFGIPAFLLVKVLSAGFFARHDTATPVKVAVTAMVVNIVGALILIGPLQHIGIALANSLAVWANAILLYLVFLRRKQKLGDEKLFYRMPRLLFCSLIMAIVTFILVQFARPLFVDKNLGLEIFGLSAVIGTSGAVYAVMLQLTGAMKWKEALSTLRRRGANKDIAKSDISSSN